MEKIFQKFDSFAEAELAEDNYYMQLSADERVNLLLELVHQYGSLFDGPAERFERVFRVASLEES